MNAALGGIALPSSNSAEHLLDGKQGSIADVLLCIAGRALFISGGVYVAGIRGKELFKVSLYASLAVETFVMGYVIYMKRIGVVAERPPMVVEGKK